MQSMRSGAFENCQCENARVDRGQSIEWSTVANSISEPCTLQGAAFPIYSYRQVIKRSILPIPQISLYSLSSVDSLGTVCKQNFRGMTLQTASHDNHFSQYFKSHSGSQQYRRFLRAARNIQEPEFHYLGFFCPGTRLGGKYF